MEPEPGEIHHQEIQGTGIGLFIVRTIVERHGGTIQVISAENQGSRFDVWLPVKQR